MRRLVEHLAGAIALATLMALLVPAAAAGPSHDDPGLSAMLTPSTAMNPAPRPLTDDGNWAVMDRATGIRTTRVPISARKIQDGGSSEAMAAAIGMPTMQVRTSAPLPRTLPGSKCARCYPEGRLMPESDAAAIGAA